MRNILVTVAILLCSVNATFAQERNFDSCIVGTADFTIDEYGELDLTRGKEIGRFEVPTPGEEDRVTRSFRLPGTKLFLVASIFYTDESMAMESGYYSAQLILAVSRRARHAITNNLAYAVAEMPANPFDIGRVRMVYRVNNRPKMIFMECKRLKRS